ncbi:response regulator [uncultured Ramlibacter sp.]|uniref:response regulator n=1 Tax=uncultured Ramlibacter sp. TaxID=260755 RepID=UPI0026183C42|nr:response regulator [uncultured Ramlibacter sp.]
MSSLPNPAPDANAPRILVVDDTPDNLFLMNGLFEERYHVLQAASGEEALRMVMGGQLPDMVLLDIMMPGMDGYEVLRRLRQHPPTAHIPVIFLSALASPPDAALGLNLGAVDYLTKPIDPLQVIQRVEQHVAAAVQERRMDALSERLSRHLSPDAWQELFHGAGRDSIAFSQKTLSVLFAESATLAGCSERERNGFATQLDTLATRYRGTVDRYGWGGTLVFFESPEACVRMAMELQRSAVRLRLRMGIHSGHGEIASFGMDGKQHQALVSSPVATLAAQAAARAEPGCTVLTPDAYALVQVDVHVDANGSVLTEDFQDSATGTLAPLPAAATPERFTGQLRN